MKNKRIAKTILEVLFKNRNTLSVTLTGSYSENFDINKAGDIDVVVICKKLNETYFKNCINKLKKIKNKIVKNKNTDLIINTTFGPIKLYTGNKIVVHLMIYDIKSHIEHTTKSPFTCYDWERSKIYIGKSLKELSPVFKIQLRDFFEARRNSNEYIKDLFNNKISYRKYKFNGKKINILKKYYSIDEINRRDFIYHIIKYLIINFIKFEKDINQKIKDRSIDKKFYEITRRKKDLNKFRLLRKLKLLKDKKYILNTKNLAINFIKSFDLFLKKKIKDQKKIIFIRHKKTLLNEGIFIGQKLNPRIVDNYIKKKRLYIKFDKCISSPSLRCIQTASLFVIKKKITVNKNLKEIDYGLVEGLTFKNALNLYPQLKEKWNKGKDPKFPKGESTKNVKNRLINFIKNNISTKKLKNAKSVLIVTHNVVMRCLIGIYFNLNINQWYKIKINHMDMIEFVFLNNKLKVNIRRDKFHDLFKDYIHMSNYEKKII